MDVPTDRWQHRRAEPRGLALLWTIYVLAVMVISFGGAAALSQPQDVRTARRAAVQVMIMLIAGVMVLWPMLRLSQARPETPPTRAVRADLLVLLPPALLVILAMRFMALWSTPVTLAVAACVTAWALLAGGVLVRALEGPGRPGAWMLGFLALSLGGLVVELMWTSAQGPGPWRMLSPFLAMLELAQDRPLFGRATQVGAPHWRTIGLTSALALAVWLLPRRELALGHKEA